MQTSTRKSLVWWALALALVMGWATPGAAQSAENKIAVVDMNRALKEVKQGKKAMVNLQKKAQQYDQELKGLQDEADKLRKDLENTAMLLKPEARLNKERDYERVVRRLRDRQRDAKQELMEAERDAFNPILRNMTGIIQQLGTQGGYSLITEAKSAFFYLPSADITNQVIAAYDKAYPQ